MKLPMKRRSKKRYKMLLIAEKFAKKLAEKADQLRVGYPTELQTGVGPLIRKSGIERIGQVVQEAISAGAECLSGGKKISESCYACTVFYHPPRTAQSGLGVGGIPYTMREMQIEKMMVIRSKEI